MAMPNRAAIALKKDNRFLTLRRRRVPVDEPHAIARRNDDLLNMFETHLRRLNALALREILQFPLKREGETPNANICGGNEQNSFDERVHESYIF
ncbi:hypothetical protein MnTg02_03295 [bacterium MnTg02]|nr:hypothetical protein MnTg02_03295 [bacterium MnTg02]